MEETTSQLPSDPWALFLYAIKSPATREKYIGRLSRFFDFLELEGAEMEEKSLVFAEKAKDSPAWVFSNVLRFMQIQRERADRKEISAGTIRNYVKAIKLFCEMNDIPISWKKITRGLPKTRRFAEDRAPTIEEIRQITEYPDRRIKAVVYTMCSSGMRLEAWEYLRWGHIQPLEREGKVVAAKITVYPGDPEEYCSFLTREAFDAINGWMEYRERGGEKITKDSWVMRDLWDIKKGCITGFISSPKQLRAGGVKRLVEDALLTQGIRTKLAPGKRRHEFQANHGFRKWFKTRCEQTGMKSINIETLMGHSLGISDSYYRPTEKELLDDYLKAADMLTINNDKVILEKKLKELTNAAAKDKQDMSERLEEQYKDILLMRERSESDMSLMKAQLQLIFSAIGSMDQSGKDELAKKMYQRGIYTASKT